MNSNTRLLRQIAPWWFSKGKFSLQIFMPRPRDCKLLSVDNGDIINPEESFISFKNRGFKSIGVLAVTVQECDNLDLSVKESLSKDNKAHADIDFTKKDDMQCAEASFVLREKAINRSWLYREE